jgi:hypothetical protein
MDSRLKVVSVSVTKVPAVLQKKVTTLLERKRERDKEKERKSKKISDFVAFGFTYKLLNGELCPQ